VSFLLRRTLLFAWLLSSIATYLHAADSAVDSCCFEIAQLVSGLIQPMELAVAPEGTVFFIEVTSNLESMNPMTCTNLMNSSRVFGSDMW
jgi:hypothetical protein